MTIPLDMEQSVVAAKYGRPERRFETLIGGHVVENWFYGATKVRMWDARVVGVGPMLDGEPVVPDR